VCWSFVGVWLAAAVIRGIVAPGSTIGPVFDRFAHDFVLVLAASLCGLRVVLRREERLAWGCVALAIASWTAGELYYTTALWTLDSVPIPSPADAGYLLMPVFMLAGLFMLRRGQGRTRTPAAARLDALVAALTVAALSAAIVLDTVADASSGDTLEVAVGLAYPVLDLLLLAAVVAALANAGWELDRRWGLLAAGITAFWVSDSLYLIQSAHDAFVSDRLLDVGWWTGLAAIAGAAWQPAPAPRATDAPPRLRTVVLPLLFAAASLALLAFGTRANLNTLAIVLALGALTAVMGRLLLSFHDTQRLVTVTHEQAVTDALTGLRNRRALGEDIAGALRAADHNYALVLFDLNGFKGYNDAFGHPAGDALLERLGASLERQLADSGYAYRMGGDEFCALIRLDEGAAEPLVVEAAAALSERGDGFDVSCAHGTVILPLEATTVDDALKLADQRMYAHKRCGRTSAGRQSADVLSRALAERSPALAAYLEDVADLADHVACELGLSDDERDLVYQAAKLHDIGKVAVPDDILNKPTPLEESERDFVRSHALIGERIIGAAPALQPVAVVVRATHEYWDGSGYPDRLRADAIPQAARIIAVVDAFSAMTSERAYRAAKPHGDALAELNACSGTQFDPAVVDAFAAVCARRTQAPRP
jgi:two-component system cell cycle response regulator